MTLSKVKKIPVTLFMAAMIVAIVAIMTVPAQAQEANRDVGNLALDTTTANQITVTWDAPTDTPTDYRVRWAPSSQDYLSWSAENTAEKGSGYPTATTHTVDGLTGGTEYKVQVRARYNGSSGPWSDEALATVSTTVVEEEDDPPPPPPADDPPASDEATNLVLDNATADQLTVTWDAPTDAPNDYRVVWGVGTSRPELPSMEC